MMLKLAVVPHNDDGPLFLSFTLQREKPLVLTVFDSVVQVQRGYVACNAMARRLEDRQAMAILGCCITFGGIGDDHSEWMASGPVRSLLRELQPSEVWIPRVEVDGHAQHNLVGTIGLEVFARNCKINRYLTYSRSIPPGANSGKTTDGLEVKPTGTELRRKLQALACYKTQLEIDALGCWPHFMDMREFIASEL